MDDILPKIGRYVGVSKSFRTYPKDLPKTIYTKDPLTNILIPSDIAHVEERPLRGFGMRKTKRWTARHHQPSRRRPQGAALEPPRGPPNGVPLQFESTRVGHPITATPDKRVGPSHSIIAISIACLVIGIAILGLSVWAIYRRRTHPVHASPDAERGPYTEVDETPQATPSVARGTPRMSASSHFAIFSKPNWSTHSSNLQTPEQKTQKRATFTHLASSVTVLYSPPVRDTPVGVWQARVDGTPRLSLHSIATLERIEEEVPPVPEAPATTPVRPLSTDTMKTAGTRSSAYTTASARSSISDLTTLSTISCLSSFPETPKDSDPVLSNGIKTSKSFGRTSRTRSQTVTSVKHVGLRTAVGRTMSLQPTKQEMEALRIQSEDMVDALRALRALEELEERPVLGELPANLNRAKTFPTKLLSRRQATSETRKSEIISGGQFREALQIFRVDHQPRLDQSFPTSPTESERTDYVGTTRVQEPELEAYYVGSDGEFEYGYFEDEESSLPHIKVTSH